MNFPREHPDYNQNIIDQLRIIDFSRLDAAGEVYLDYTGAGLYPESLVMNHLWDLRDKVYGNPHSDSPTSLRSTNALSEARAAVLSFFNADPQHYDVVFTANATAAMQLVGLSYPYSPDNCLLYTADVHNSALGLREIPAARGCPTLYVPLRPDLRIDDANVAVGLNQYPDRAGLFVYPAQCNFSGVQHPLEWIGLAHDFGWRVLLDAAAFVPTNPLDLTRHRADYIAVSWYKVFGYPTGIGALVATREALAALQQPWHSGGTTRAASVAGHWYHLAAGRDGFEHGTTNYLAARAVQLGCEFVQRIGLASIHDRVELLTAWTLDLLAQLRHSNGNPVVTLYGPADTHLRGGAIAFNFLDPAGGLVDERLVALRAQDHHLSLRTGCFCAPGVGEVAFGLGETALAAARDVGATAPFDAYLNALDMPTGGAIRISYGLASTAADAERFAEFATTFVDQPIGDPITALPERVHC